MLYIFVKWNTCFHYCLLIFVPKFGVEKYFLLISMMRTCTRLLTKTLQIIHLNGSVNTTTFVILELYLTCFRLFVISLPNVHLLNFFYIYNTSCLTAHFNAESQR